MYQPTARIAANDILRGGARQGEAHVHERIRQRRSSVRLVGHCDFILGNESLIAEPAKDGAHADHAERSHFNSAECTHAGRSQDNRPGAKGGEDLQR